MDRVRCKALLQRQDLVRLLEMLLRGHIASESMSNPFQESHVLIAREPKTKLADRTENKT
jgi:hypothetical protein